MDMQEKDLDFYFPIMREMMSPIKKPTNRKETREMSSEAIRIFKNIYKVESNFIEEILSDFDSEENNYATIYNEYLEIYIQRLEILLRNIKPSYFVVFPHYFSNKYKPVEQYKKRNVFILILKAYILKMIKYIGL